MLPDVLMAYSYYVVYTVYIEYACVTYRCLQAGSRIYMNSNNDRHHYILGLYIIIVLARSILIKSKYGGEKHAPSALSHVPTPDTCVKKGLHVDNCKFKAVIYYIISMGFGFGSMVRTNTLLLSYSLAGQTLFYLCVVTGAHIVSLQQTDMEEARKK